MRLLPVRYYRRGQGATGPQPGAQSGGDRGGDDPRRSRDMSDTLPLSIQNNRRMDKWVRFNADRTVRLAVGKVELGQGNVTALAQIAAEELDVDLARIAVLAGRSE